MADEKQVVDPSTLPIDSVVVAGDDFYIARIPSSGAAVLDWIKVEPDEQERAIVQTKLRMMGAMLLDDARNAAYYEAIRRAVRPGDVVLDAGAGTGLLSMIAAKCGAKHVYACEMNESIARLAQRIVQKNNLSDVVTVVHHRTDEVIIAKGITDSPSSCTIPHEVDVIVSETMDSVLTTEGMIETLRDAITRLGKPNCRVIPSKGFVVGRLVDLNGPLRELHGEWQSNGCQQVDPLLIHGASKHMNQWIAPLSPEIQLASLDFAENNVEPLMKWMSRTSLDDERTPKAIHVWWKVELFEDVTISTGGNDALWQDHWHQALYFIPAEAGKGFVEVECEIYPQTGKMRCSLISPNNAAKRAHVDLQPTQLSRMESIWRDLKWKDTLSKELLEVRRHQSIKGLPALLDLSKSKLASKCSNENPSMWFASTASQFNPAVAVSSDSPIPGATELDAVLHFAFQCAAMPRPPVLTIPSRAIVKCAAVRFHLLKDPRDHLQVVSGFSHEPMLETLKVQQEFQFWSFPLVICNYDFDIASISDSVVANIDFGNGLVELQEGSAKLELEGPCTALVYWVEYLLNDGSSMELASVHSPGPFMPSVVSFINNPSGAHIAIKASIDSRTNRFIFDHKTL